MKSNTIKNNLFLINYMFNFVTVIFQSKAPERKQRCSKTICLNESIYFNFFCPLLKTTDKKYPISVPQTSLLINSITFLYFSPFAFAPRIVRFYGYKETKISESKGHLVL